MSNKKLDETDPFVFSKTTPDGDPPQRGIRLSDYYSAHAPRVPRWFKPKVDAKPEKPNRFFVHFANHEHNDKIKAHWNDEQDEWDATALSENMIPESLQKEVREYLENWKKWTEASAKWEAMYEWEKIIQWRFQYAEKMLQHRSK